jgi:hypothetical protein
MESQAGAVESPFQVGPTSFSNASVWPFLSTAAIGTGANAEDCRRKIEATGSKNLKPTNGMIGV